MNAADFSKKIEDAREPSDPSGWWSGLCPAHDDRSPSFGWRDGDYNKIRVRCQAGCSREKVLAALNLTEDDTWLRPPSGDRVVAKYTYTDEKGMPLFQAVRYAKLGGGKTFSLRRPDPADSSRWVNNVKGVRLVLYNLDALQGRGRVVVVEGEKDADRLNGLGTDLKATTSPMGAGKWRDEYAQQLVAAGVLYVFILPDNDEAGERHEVDVRESCLAAGLFVVTVRLPGLPPGGDVSDYLDANTADDLDDVMFTPGPRRVDVLPERMDVLADRLIVQGLAEAGFDPRGRDRQANIEAMGEALASLPASYWKPYSLEMLLECAAESMDAVLDERLAVVRASDITPKNVQWTWRKRVPSGVLTLIVGDPGVNKSTFCLDYAARVTTGRPWPDGSPGSGKPETVLYLSAEDSPESTLIPRFMAMGGDRRFLLFQRLEMGDALFSLKDDVEKLERTVGDEDVRHIVIDPVNAYLPGVNAWRDEEVRRALLPLAMMAGRTGVTALGVMHMNKKSDYTALQRVMGSVGFAAMARAVYYVVKDKDSPETRRLFLIGKINDAPPPSGLAFRLVPTMEGKDPDGEPIETLKIEWETSAVIITADEALQPPENRTVRPRAEAAELIVELLKDGPVLAETMENELRKAGVAEKTARRAKDKAGVQSIKVGNAWYWAPPGFTKAQRAEWQQEDLK